MKKLFVGNLPYTATEDDLAEMFGKHGAVSSCKIIMDRDTGRSKGFAFIEMDNAEAAMAALNDTDLGGRNIHVNEAQDRPKDASGGRRPSRDSRPQRY